MVDFSLGIGFNRTTHIIYDNSNSFNSGVFVQNNDIRRYHRLGIIFTPSIKVGYSF